MKNPRHNSLPKRHPGLAMLVTEANIRSRCGGWCPGTAEELTFLSAFFDEQDTIQKNEMEREKQKLLSEARMRR